VWIAVGISVGGPQVVTSSNGQLWLGTPTTFPSFGLSVAAKRPLYPPLP
jgi:hypothetical protein